MHYDDSHIANKSWDSLQVSFTFGNIALTTKMPKELLILLVIFGVSTTMNIQEKEDVISTGKL